MSVLKGQVSGRNNPILSDILAEQESTRIACGYDLWLRGEKVDAINFPDQNPKTIVYDCGTWQNLSTAQRESLIVHEMAYIAGYNDAKYDYSAPIVTLYDNAKMSPVHAKINNQLLLAAKDCNENAFEKNKKFSDADINWENSRGYNALTGALLSNCGPLTEKLYDRGARLYNETSEGLSFLPIVYAKSLLTVNKWDPSTGQMTKHELRKFFAQMMADSPELLDVNINTCAYNEYAKKNNDYLGTDRQMPKIESENCEDISFAQFTKSKFVKQ
jgi:hypothetical protein